MFRQQLVGLALLLAVTAGVAAADQLCQKEPEADLPAYAAVAPLEGEICSPDGRFYVRQMGADTSITAAGLYPAGANPAGQPEERRSFMGGHRLLSSVGAVVSGEPVCGHRPAGPHLPSGHRHRYADLSCLGCDDAGWWTDPGIYVLPDGSSWGSWQNENTLLLTVGLGGDSGPQRFYRCALRSQADQLTGSTLEQTRQSLPGLWDFDGDGAPETAEVTTVWSPEGTAAWYELHIKGGWLHSLEPGRIFLIPTPAGVPCLPAKQTDRTVCCGMTPGSGQGLGSYSYELFTLNTEGEEVSVRKTGWSLTPAVRKFWTSTPGPSLLF